MSRRDEIRDRLAEHLLDLCGVAIVCPSKEAWSKFPVEGHHRFGWLPPTPVDDEGLLPLVAFCPALIADVTEWLDDEQLDLYLWTIERLLDGCIDNPQRYPVEALCDVEDELAETDPDALALLSAVELRALDNINKLRNPT